ncbi:hypothetical protein FWH13_04015 [Candidatus Saccharibacteria bacterium]|nr:hypothetical protein [Candidatus Saccharibacteria bacterium]
MNQSELKQIANLFGQAILDAVTSDLSGVFSLLISPTNEPALASTIGKFFSVQETFGPLSSGDLHKQDATCEVMISLMLKCGKPYHAIDDKTIDVELPLPGVSRIWRFTADSLDSFLVFACLSSTQSKRDESILESALLEVVNRLGQVDHESIA